MPKHHRKRQAKKQFKNPHQSITINVIGLMVLPPPPPTSLTTTSATSTHSIPTAVSLAPSAGPSFVLTTRSKPIAHYHPAKLVSRPITFNSPIQFPYENLSPDITHSFPNTNPTQTPSTTSLPNSPDSFTHNFNERSPRPKNVMSQAARSLQFTEPRSRTLREYTQTQRKAEPLWKANLPWDVTHRNSPSSGNQTRNTKRTWITTRLHLRNRKTRRATRRKKTQTKRNHFHRKREEPETKKCHYM